jgi:hypothetical protein
LIETDHTYHGAFSKSHILLLLFALSRDFCRTNQLGQLKQMPNRLLHCLIARVRQVLTGNKHNIPSRQYLIELFSHGLAHQAFGPIAYDRAANAAAGRETKTASIQPIRSLVQHQPSVGPTLFFRVYPRKITWSGKTKLTR